MSDKNFSHAATVLPVDDVRATADYYRDMLGFEISFEWGDPVTYAVLKRGESVSVHVVERDDDSKPSSVHTALYVFVHDVDKVYYEYRSKGVEIASEIGDREYGMRDFDIKDINGFLLSFSMNL
ncbi:MAG: glyoxalase [Pyrinomonadaceae bacterium]|nr:glyoxalase [Pyrinomonadaceae bacterium]